MAISKSISTIYGIKLENAYIRIENIRISPKTVISYDVCYYADQSNPEIEVKRFECSYDMNGVNPMIQAYDYLKSLPEFADAVDC